MRCRVGSVTVSCTSSFRLGARKGDSSTCQWHISSRRELHDALKSRLLKLKHNAVGRTNRRHVKF